MNEAFVVSLTCTFGTSVGSRRSTEESTAQECDARNDDKNLKSPVQKNV